MYWNIFNVEGRVGCRAGGSLFHKFFNKVPISRMLRTGGTSRNHSLELDIYLINWFLRTEILILLHTFSAKPTNLTDNWICIWQVPINGLLGPTWMQLDGVYLMGYRFYQSLFIDIIVIKTYVCVTRNISFLLMPWCVVSSDRHEWSK